MLQSLLTPQTLVYVAGAFYAAGMIIINQVALRSLVLVGTGLYILYYFTVAESPLWEAIYISTLIGSANIFGLTNLLARRSRFAIPRAHADIYSHFAHLPPGDFRELVNLAHRHTVSEAQQITTEGAPGRVLVYVISGTTQVVKGDNRFALPPRIFIGEVAYLIDVPSSATTWLEPGAEVLEWSFETLRRRAAKNPRFKLALDSAVSFDLARKVAAAVAPNKSPTAAPQPDPTGTAAMAPEPVQPPRQASSTP